MGYKVKFSLVLVISLVIFAKIQAQLSKEAYATVPQLVAAAGFPVEKHRATTEDGYVLQLHRIPAGRRTARRAAGEQGKGKKAVLVVHGLMGSSGDYVIMGPDRSLAYLLADGGYDVWLANLRGNQYTTHRTLTRDNPEFWKYSFHEHGKYDLPATIDKVLNVTGLPRIMYVGWSMGAASFFTMMSQKPEYNDKIIAFVALAPAVYLDTIKPTVELLLTNLKATERMKAEGLYSLNVPSQMRDLVATGLCSAKTKEQDVCWRLVYSIVGEDYEQNDWNISPLVIARAQPASVGQLEHFGKIALTGVFTSFDGGVFTPPKPYNFSNVRVPTTIMYGENDQLTHKSQVMRLASALNATGVLEDVRPATSWPKFNHLDFGFAKDLGKLLNKPLVKYLNKQYNKYGPH